MIRLTTIFILFFSVSSAVAVDYVARWNRPQKLAEILKDFTGLPTLDVSQRTAIEVGPSSEPICEDCLYLDAFAKLEKPDQIARLIVGDARQMPIRSKSIDVLMFKNFPWLLSSNVKTFGFDQIRSNEDPEKFKRHLADAHMTRQWVFAELNRVLKDDGAFLILFSLAGDYPGELLKHLSEFVVEAEAMGFQAKEVRNIKDLSSDYVRKIATRGKRAVPLGGLIFHRPDSFILKSQSCAPQLLRNF